MPATTGAVKQASPQIAAHKLLISQHLCCRTSAQPAINISHSCFFSPSFPCHPLFQLPEGKAKEQKDRAGNGPGIGIYTVEKNGGFGWWGWFQGFSVKIWIAQEALKRITAHTATALLFILCRVSSSPLEKYLLVWASVQQSLQPIFTKMVALACTLCASTIFYFFSDQAT